MGASLSDVMNELAGGKIISGLTGHAIINPLSEIDYFVQLDATLEELQYRYQQAKEYAQAACREHGAESPMADLAIDMEDSAWCAMQTRLMELRAQGDLMRLV